MKEKILEIKKSAEEEIKNVSSLEELNNFRVKYAGKSGLLTEVMRGMRDVPKEERPVLGALVNEVRTFVEGEIESLEKKLSLEKLNEKFKVNFLLDTKIQGFYLCRSKQGGGGCSRA